MSDRPGTYVVGTVRLTCVAELCKRAGKEDKAGKQLLLNAELHKAVERIAERGARISAGERG